MTEHDLSQKLEVGEDDRTVATAEVTTSAESGGTARVSLHAESGHIHPGRRASLVDAVLDLPEVRSSAHLEVAFRLGDTESLQRLQERCEEVTTHPAGWSALFDGNLPASAARSSAAEPATPDPATPDPAWPDPAAQDSPAQEPAARGPATSESAGH